MRPGEDGLPLRGIWTAEEREQTIAFRELRALRLVLEHHQLVAAKNAPGLSGRQRKVLCWVEKLCDRVYRSRHGDGVKGNHMIGHMPELQLLQELLLRT